MSGLVKITHCFLETSVSKLEQLFWCKVTFAHIFLLPFWFLHVTLFSELAAHPGYWALWGHSWCWFMDPPQKAGFHLPSLEANQWEWEKGAYRIYTGGLLGRCPEPWPGNLAMPINVCLLSQHRHLPGQAQALLSAPLGSDPGQTPQPCLTIMQNSLFWKLRLSPIRCLY